MIPLIVHCMYACICYNTLQVLYQIYNHQARGQGDYKSDIYSMSRHVIINIFPERQNLIRCLLLLPFCLHYGEGKLLFSCSLCRRQVLYLTTGCYVIVIEYARVLLLKYNP